MTKPKFSHADYRRETKLRAERMEQAANRLQKALDAMTRARVG